MSGGAWDIVMGNYNGLQEVVVSKLMNYYKFIQNINKYYTTPGELNNGYGVNYDLNIWRPFMKQVIILIAIVVLVGTTPGMVI